LRIWSGLLVGYKRSIDDTSVRICKWNWKSLDERNI
jgi:hypothetical protein